MSTPGSEIPTPSVTRRKYPRASTQKMATIFISPETPPIRCAVLDMSVSGAGISLWVGSTFGIPNNFELQVDGEPAKRHCRVAWMKPHKLGVEFK
jgi:hypothetical protein